MDPDRWIERGRKMSRMDWSRSDLVDTRVLTVALSWQPGQHGRQR